MEFKETKAKKMKREDILLYFIYISVKNLEFMSPIQIMKGMFLVKQELNPPNFYQFEPYLYGPCSFEVYNDLDILTRRGLITKIPSFRGWFYYKSTSLAEGKIREISKQLEQKMADKILEIKEFITRKNIFELLSYIYRKYPEYAKNSLINIEALTT